MADVNKDLVILGHKEKVVEDSIDRDNEDKKLPNPHGYESRVPVTESISKG